MDTSHILIHTYLVAMDASSSGTGAFISHHFLGVSQKVISHAAHTLKQAKCNYSPLEKEALVLIFMIKKFHKMLYSQYFTFMTDHKQLLCLD